MSLDEAGVPIRYPMQAADSYPYWLPTYGSMFRDRDGWFSQRYQMPLSYMSDDGIDGRARWLPTAPPGKRRVVGYGGVFQN
jgi:hypothetical protein